MSGGGGNFFQSIGDAVQSIGGAIGSAVQSIGNAIQPIVHKFETDPIGSIAMVVASATGQVWALPIISAADTIAHGGSLTQAAEGAALSYVAGNIASGISSAMLAPAANSTASMMAADAAGQIAQGIPADQVAATLQQTYASELANLPQGMTADTLTNSLANAAANGVAPSTLATAYAGRKWCCTKHIINRIRRCIWRKPRWCDEHRNSIHFSWCRG